MEACKFQLGASSCCHITTVVQLYRQGIKNSRYHLAGHKPLPNKLIQAELILVKIFLNSGWGINYTGRPNCLMGILSLLASSINISLGGIILLTIVFYNIRLGLCLSHFRNTGRISSHIGNQTRHSLTAQFNTFIELLGHHHGFPGGKPQLSCCILLQAGGSKRSCCLTAALSFLNLCH